MSKTRISLYQSASNKQRDSIPKNSKKIKLTNKSLTNKTKMTRPSSLTPPFLLHSSAEAKVWELKHGPQQAKKHLYSVARVEYSSVENKIVR